MEPYGSLWSARGTIVGLKSPFAHVKKKHLEKAFVALLNRLALAGSIWIH